jgi:hypothetical protein
MDPWMSARSSPEEDGANDISDGFYIDNII